MSNKMQKRLPIVLVLVLAIMLASVVSLTVANGVATADDAPTLQNSLEIGQFSDIHYFPLAYCYQDVKADDYEQSEFFKSMTGDTKLVLESGMILKQQIEGFIKDAKAGKAPVYVFASGDLSKNGEVKALIDVANSLRYLQNTVRALGGKYANFQIFATVGNHDLYNTSGALYSSTDGTARQSDALTTAQFALVFAGLGYPDANLDGADGKINLTEYMPEEYWSDVFTDGYQVSYNATNLNIHYYNEHLEAVNTTLKSQDTATKLNEYYQIGYVNNALSFSVDLTNAGYKDYAIMIIDASDRSDDEVGAYVRINKAEYEVIKNSTQRNGSPYKYYLSLGNDTIDTENPLSAGDHVLENALTNGDVVYRSTGLDHLCGGRLTEGLLDWMQEFCNDQNAMNDVTLGEKTIISCFHQNALPHWEMEDEILKDFTIWNWENTAKRLLDMGIRYVFSGHMHVCDAMTYTDVEGRTLYDFQTGSFVSYNSPRRYTTFNRYDSNNSLKEECVSQIFNLDTDGDTPFKEVPSSRVFSCDAWDPDAFDSAKAVYDANKTHENWENLVATNPDYLAYIITFEDSSELSYNDYISKDVYSRLVERMVSHFIDPDTILGMLDGVYDLLKSGGTFTTIIESAVFPQLGLMDFTDNMDAYDEYYDVHDGTIDSENATVKLVEWLVDEVLYNGGYVHNDVTYNNAFDLVNNIVDDIINWSYGDENIQSPNNTSNKGKLALKDMASFIMTSHTMGNEISFEETYESIDALYSETKNVGDDTYRYQHPFDATYRKRMLSAMKDLNEQLISGEFVEDLLTAILDPLFNEDGSILKTLLTKKFNFHDAVDDGYLTNCEFMSLKKGLGSLSELLNNPAVSSVVSNIGIDISIPEDFAIDAENLVVGDLIDDFLPTVKSLVASLLGFSMEGDSLISIAQNFLDSYLVDSFYVGLGGIAKDIIFTFGTDVYPDLANMADATLQSYYTPQGVSKDKAFSYASTDIAPSKVDSSFNQATQDNGRVPSRVTGNFDTANSQNGYTIKFYTEEYVYGTFRLLDENGNVLTEVSTSRADALNAYKTNSANMPYLDTSATKSIDGISITLSTQTKPQYIPLIDLGLLCLTHGEIAYEDAEGNEIEFIYGQRDDAVSNSVIYWNVHTVNISGLEAGKTYYYDICGNYECDNDETAYFSLVDYIKLDGYEGNSLTLTTAPDSSVDAFEFLTIADIQGMIQSMYDSSHEAVDALLADERVNSFDFILNAGDMCDNGKNFAQWGMALNTYQDLNLNTSVFFTAGNHENGSGAMGRYFNYTSLVDGQSTPISGEYYSFDYANAHFVVLDTNDADSNGLGEAQYEWLVNDLANNNAKWTFVLMHKSLYSAGSHALDGEVIAMRSQLGKLFANSGVNIVFGGHDHSYTTTYLIDANGNIADKSNESVRYTGDGVLYITLGTMGTKYYNYKENNTTTDKFDTNNSILHTLDSQTFGKVVVEGDSILYTGYYYDRTTGNINEIGAIELSATSNKLTTILLATLIPCGVIIIGVGVGLGIFFSKKKKAQIKSDAE